MTAVYPRTHVKLCELLPRPAHLAARDTDGFLVHCAVNSWARNAYLEVKSQVTLVKHGWMRPAHTCRETAGLVHSM